jgi:hypothetical protein
VESGEISLKKSNYMKFLITIILSVITFHKAMGLSKLDTLANWQIYYGEKLITAGHEPNSRTPDPGIITIKGKAEKLKIVYTYDAVKPEVRTIKIKRGKETLYDQTEHLKDNHPALIDLNEVLKKKKGDFEIQIYYTDDRMIEKNRLIGVIKIIINE